MKTYRERTDDILARAEGMRKRSRRNTLISVLAVCLAALCGLLLLLFVPYANAEMPTLAEYRGSDYYPLMQKINTLTYRAPKYKNNFEALTGCRICSAAMARRATRRRPMTAPTKATTTSKLPTTRWRASSKATYSKPRRAPSFT